MEAFESRIGAYAAIRTSTRTARKIVSVQQRDVVATREHEHREHDREQVSRLQPARGHDGRDRRHQEGIAATAMKLAEVTSPEHVGDEVSGGDEDEPGDLRPPTRKPGLPCQTTSCRRTRGTSHRGWRLVGDDRWSRAPTRGIRRRSTGRSRRTRRRIEDAQRFGGNEEPGPAVRLNVHLLLANEPEVKGPVVAVGSAVTASGSVSRPITQAGIQIVVRCTKVWLRVAWKTQESTAAHARGVSVEAEYSRGVST